MNELKEKAIEFIALNNENHILLVAPVKTQFIELFTLIFGKKPSCASCGDKVAKEYAELVEFAKGTHSIYKYSMSAYKLKNHKSIFDPVTNRYYIYKSPLWSDEIALNILSNQPQQAFRFNLPADHEARLQAYLDARALVNSPSMEARIISDAEKAIERYKNSHVAYGLPAPIEGDNVVVNDETFEEVEEANSIITTENKSQFTGSKKSKKRGRK